MVMLLTGINTNMIKKRKRSKRKSVNTEILNKLCQEYGIYEVAFVTGLYRAAITGNAKAAKMILKLRGY